LRWEGVLPATPLWLVPSSWEVSAALAGVGVEAEGDAALGVVAGDEEGGTFNELELQLAATEAGRPGLKDASISLKTTPSLLRSRREAKS
jgi:hypothetical protein